MDFKVGHVLVDTYRIERLIAEGGMGSVYEAAHLRVPKRFAVKFLNVQLVDKSEALVRFRREAEIIATLDHPNIVNLFDYNVTDDGIPYIVLEYLDGEHLGKRLDKGKLPLREAIRVVVPVVHALAAAHKRGIVHRDLKPENIVLCRGDQVKVVDFGIAKICGYDLTGMNSIIGTVPYMSPEQIGGGGIDGRADQFALGSILYEMLGGKMAFGGSQSVPEVAMRVMHHQPPFLSEVSQVVNETIFKAMSKDPNGRYADLESFLNGLLDAASRPDDVSVVVEGADDEEGLPELAGEATAITRAAPMSEDARSNIHLVKTASVSSPVGAPLNPLVTPAVAGPSPLARAQGFSITHEKTPASAPPSGLPPLAEESTEIKPNQPPRTPVPIPAAEGEQPVWAESQAATAVVPRLASTTPGQSPAVARPSTVPPSPIDAARYKPLVTQATPILDISQGPPPSASVPITAIRSEHQESTAVTVRPVAPTTPAVPDVRLLHAVATVRQATVDGNGARVDAADNLRMTAQVARPTLPVPTPTSATDGNDPGSDSHEDHTGKMQLPPPESESRAHTPSEVPTADKRFEAVDSTGASKSGSPLALLWITVAVAAVVVLVGLLARHFVR